MTTTKPAGESPVELLRQELAATNALLLGFSRELSATRVETAVRVEGLRAEQNRERRVRMIAVAGGGFGLFVVTDQDVEHCSPGSRVVRGVDYLIHHPATAGDASEATRANGFTHVYNSSPAWCDVVQPFHTHDGRTWPTTMNTLGMLVVGSVALLVAAYHRWKTHRDFSRVHMVAAIEERHQGSAGDQ